MNAHSTIVGRKRRALAERVRSRAFQKGLLEGFAAPTLFVGANDYARFSRMDASLTDAWKAVGDALRTASEKKGAELGKSTREAKSPD